MIFWFPRFVRNNAPLLQRPIESLLIMAATAAAGAYSTAGAQNITVSQSPASISPAATQPAAMVLLSAGSAQAPAPAALPAPTAPVKPSAPGSFAAFAHDLLTRDTLTGDWWGLRGDLDSHGITPTITLLQAASENFSGGIRTNRIDWRYRLDVSLTLDTEKLFGWKGGCAFVDFMAHGGQNPANDLVGELQAISAIDQNPATRLDQIWYRQNLLDGNLWFKLGRIDTTYDFDNIRDAQAFLNGSFGFSPVIFVFPSYPFSAWGGEVSWQPVSALTLHGGLFDGNTENTVPDVASANPNAVENPYGILALAEESLNWRISTHHLSGTFTLGEWYHTGTFQRYSGSSVQDAKGFYAYLDQTLWTFGHAKGQTASRIGSFVQYAWANDQLTEIDQNISGGLRWRGPIPGRIDDNTGIAATWAHLSPYAQTPYNYELAIEGFYTAQVTPWLSIQPDLQYIIHPGGIYQNALVATVQVAIQF
ncbi:MAG: carbohydrate porin [Phycisphaerae bacterium]